MKLVKINSELAWAIVAYHVNRVGQFKSVTGITYVARVTGDQIFYQGGDRNNGEEEAIDKSDFVEAFDSIAGLRDINTNTIKNITPSSLYRKRTPFIGMLTSAKILRIE